jgi:hypothetical protein
MKTLCNKQRALYIVALSTLSMTLLSTHLTYAEDSMNTGTMSSTAPTTTPPVTNTDMKRERKTDTHQEQSKGPKLMQGVKDAK